MTKYILAAILSAILVAGLLSITSLNVNGKQMTCDLATVKSCTIIARHGDVEIDKLIILNKISNGGGGGGAVIDQGARDQIAALAEQLNQTRSELGNSTINNLVIETQNPENTTTTNETNNTGGVLPNENNTNATG